MVGPRIFTAGPAFTFPGSHPAQVATAEMPLALASADPEEMKNMVREVASKGVDFIKIAVEADIPRPGVPRMPPELIEAVVEEARRNDLRVGCHCTSVDEATDAVRAGVEVLVHWVRSDHGPITEEFIDLLQSNDVFVIPTLGVYNVDLARQQGGPFRPVTLRGGRLAQGVAIRRRRAIRPDGQELIVVGDRLLPAGGAVSIYVFIDGIRPPRFFAAPGGIHGEAGRAEYLSDFNHVLYDLTPDGQQFVMLRAIAADTGELIWVQNWFEELKAKVGNE